MNQTMLQSGYLSKRVGNFASALAFAMTCLSAPAAEFGQQLLLNGNAELGEMGAWNGSMSVVPSSLAGTLGLSTPTATQNWILSASGSPLAMGSMSQIVDISSLWQEVDQFAVSVSFSALIQGTGMSTNQDAYLFFLDAGGDRLVLSAILGDPSFAGAPDWAESSVTVTVVPGTRALEVLVAGRALFGESGPYFDNFSLVLSPVPEVPTAVLLLAGCFVLRLRASRRHAQE